MEQLFDEKAIRKELKIDAKGIGIPSGAAEIFIDKTLSATKQKLKSKKIITSQDLERIITTELKKYNADFAYVYENRDKII
ncbi:hypothetical protein IKF32_00515 [Candidatus Saccharibacteria bacterium]|nr:hypothetical protein [Candidatus Saccharibacteria bacterium]